MQSAPSRSRLSSGARVTEPRLSGSGLSGFKGVSTRRARVRAPRNPMFFAEALRFSLQALRANKVRTFLTALGLVIGNASVILVVTISLTSRDYILEQIRGIGSNMVYAYYEAGTQDATRVQADFVKMADVVAVREQ